MTKFGYSYPAGAENDPFAPYNQDAPRGNAIIKDAFSDYDGPYSLYRAVYRATECGPSVGVRIEFENTGEDGFGVSVTLTEKWIYCDDLHSLGTWADMDKQGTPITALCVSSIVEGVEMMVPAIEIIIDEDQSTPEGIQKAFFHAVKDVNEQASEIWNATHGCDNCGPEDEESGYRQVNPNCSACGGEGTIF